MSVFETLPVVAYVVRCPTADAEVTIATEQTHWDLTLTSGPPAVGFLCWRCERIHRLALPQYADIADAVSAHVRAFNAQFGREREGYRSDGITNERKTE